MVLGDGFGSPAGHDKPGLSESRTSGPEAIPPTDQNVLERGSFRHGAVNPEKMLEDQGSSPDKCQACEVVSLWQSQISLNIFGLCMDGSMPSHADNDGRCIFKWLRRGVYVVPQRSRSGGKKLRSGESTNLSGP